MPTGNLPPTHIDGWILGGGDRAPARGPRFGLIVLDTHRYNEQNISIFIFTAANLIYIRTKIIHRLNGGKINVCHEQIAYTK
jgi:hypothetical protein